MTLPAGAGLSPAQIAQRSRSNFLIGFRSLDAAARAAMTAVYAFCRVVDDAVDDAADADAGRAALAFWRDELERAAEGTPTTPVGRELQGAMQRHGVAAAHLREVTEGMAMDLEPPAYRTLPELEVYCYRVASAVGLACLPIMGAGSVEAAAFAERLGQALQLTNILRDLRADAEAGRIYVPRDWLEHCAVEPGWLTGAGPPAIYAPAGPVARLCSRLSTAACARFAQARSALLAAPPAERRRLLPARIMGAIYGDLLARLTERGGDLRRPRVRVPKFKKVWLVATLKLGLRQ